MASGDHPSPAGNEREFTAMSDKFRATGGLQTADDVAGRVYGGRGVGVIARWIVDRQVVNLLWAGTYWLPQFQFVVPAMQLRDSIGITLSELTASLNDWEVANWFATPNGRLGTLCPAEALIHLPAEVFEAARGHRFATSG